MTTLKEALAEVAEHGDRLDPQGSQDVHDGEAEQRGTQERGQHEASEEDATWT